ncbi:unnamed protein product [Blepharisma stoltei]|uniref:Uncharacterized protein n=1 Tax=Blepharisma stoltei TaxID=1481888 RepID=A0AAU9JSE2_9CILI|nr:unnamed protein product [Blepharisma stoltei]
MKCWKDQCESKLEFACPCTDPPVYSCDTHIAAHMKTASRSRHLPDPLTISPNPETKRALIDCLHKSLSDLYELRKKTVLDFSMQIKQINEKMKIALKSFDDSIKNQRKIISEIQIVEVISNFRKTQIDKILVAEPEEAINLLKDSFDIFDRSKFFIDDTGKLTKVPLMIESNRFIIFRDNSTKIVQTDLNNNYSSTELNISLNSPQSVYTTMCIIPGNSVFCCGNYPNTANAFIIDSNTNVKKVIDAPDKLGVSGSIYYNKSVYVFGGYTGQAHVNNAYRYYFLENKWENLNPLPAKSTFVSCIAKNNKILLSGREHSKIYCYDIIQNSYIELHNIQAGIWRKIICENNKNAYVIEAGGYIYEGNQEWNYWSTIGSSGTENNVLIGCTVLWQNKAYFAFCTNNFYEFDMKEKRCKKIKNI